MKKLGNKIKKILSVDSDSFRLKLKFEDGFTGEVDLSIIFSKPKALAAEVMRGALFNKCFIESGCLAWPNGLELCADFLRMKMVSKVENVQAK